MEQEPMFDSLPFILTLTTRWVGHPLLFVQAIDSTNRLLRDMAREGAAEGSVILTDYQRVGRGRRGREWVTPPASSLLFSTLLRPPVWTERESLLPIVISIAVARALEGHLGLKPEIKWPNDILLAGRKCCGILIESEWDHKGVPNVIIGIGLNVNQAPDGFGDLPTATSLRLAKGDNLPLLERGPLFSALLHEMEEALDGFRRGWQPHKAWRKRATWLGQPILIQRTAGNAQLATAIDLAEDGSLLVQMPDGTSQQLHAGDVSVRPYTKQGL
jgi:BirA family biotin operon repressor/biotin-[acetyl-CoA-carboxylase] ligase